MKKLLVLILSAIILCSCAAESIAEKPTEMPVATVTSTETEHTLYLPDQAPFYYTCYNTEAGDLVFPDEIICTNTTEISVKNRGDIPLTCNLYHSDDLNGVIQTFDVRPGKTGVFRLLTSASAYYVGFVCGDEGTIDVKISG